MSWTLNPVVAGEMVGCTPPESMRLAWSSLALGNESPVNLFVFYLSYTLGETGGGKFVLGWGDGETIFLFCMILQSCSCCRHCMLCLVHVTMQALLSKE